MLSEKFKSDVRKLHEWDGGCHCETELFPCIVCEYEQFAELYPEDTDDKWEAWKAWFYND